MLPQITLYTLLFSMISCFIHKQNHLRILPLKLRHVVKKHIAISILVLPEKLRTILSQTAKPYSSTVRTCNQHARLASFHSPYSAQLNIVYERALILNYDHPSYRFTCQVRAVFFKKSSRSSFLEKA